jgi:hypothetical protein
MWRMKGRLFVSRPPRKHVANSVKEFNSKRMPRLKPNISKPNHRNHEIDPNRNRPHMTLLLQQNGYGSVPQVCNREVEFAIAVKICLRDCDRIFAYQIRRAQCRRKGAVAMSQQERNRAVTGVCDSEIQFSIVVEIPSGDCVRLHSNLAGEAGAVENCPVPSPRRMVTLFAVLLQTARSSFAVRVEIGHCEKSSGRGESLLREGAITFPQQDVCTVDDKIEFPILVKVSGGGRISDSLKALGNAVEGAAAVPPAT